MRAQELRLGNITETLRTNGNPNNWVRMEITGHHIITCGTHPEWFRPIPLTKYLLERLGLNKQKHEEDGIIYQRGKLVVKFKKGIYWFWFSDSEDDWYYTTSISIQYVHQLQNLYFALTGEELEIKKP
jgi:hypothetical protein